MLIRLKTDLSIEKGMLRGALYSAANVACRIPFLSQIASVWADTPEEQWTQSLVFRQQCHTEVIFLHQPTVRAEKKDAHCNAAQHQKLPGVPTGQQGGGTSSWFHEVSWQRWWGEALSEKQRHPRDRCLLRQRHQLRRSRAAFSSPIQNEKLLSPLRKLSFLTHADTLF